MSNDAWGRDLTQSFMYKDLARSGLVPDDFPFGVEAMGVNEDGVERYKINMSLDYWQMRLDRKENKYYAPKGVVPPIVTFGDFHNAPVVATVEGYKKGLLFYITTSIPTFVLTGCWMFGELMETDQQAVVKNLASPILANLTPGQDHFVLFDGDVVTKEDVRRAASTYRVLLEEQNAHVRFKNLGCGPDGARYGYDDWFIANYGTDRDTWPDQDELFMTIVKDVPTLSNAALLDGALAFMLGNIDRFSSEFLDLNDRGAGSLLIKLIGADNLKYLRDTGEWVQWSWVKELGTYRWINLGDMPINLVNVAAKYFFERAAILEAHAKKYTDEPDRAKAFTEQARQYRSFASTSCSNTTPRQNILKDLTKGGRREIYALASDFDAKAYLLGVANGVVDLRTGVLREETQEDFITRHCNVPYVMNPSPALDNGRNVEQFLTTTFGARHGTLDPVFYSYIQRRLGIALWGGNKLQSFEIWQGGGSDGKSALALMIQGALGDSSRGGYAAATKPEVIMSGFKGTNPEGASPFLVLLRGARLVFASETKDNASLNEALIKQLSGGEKLQARANYQDGGSFKVDFTFHLMTNPMPNCSSLDGALLSRLAILPFKVQWKRAQDQTTDSDHLPLGDSWWVEDAAEDVGVRIYILWWLIQGCKGFFEAPVEQRLGELPQRCRAAIEAYKEDADVLAAWMGEYGIVFDAAAITGVSDLYRSYKDYVLGAGHQPLSTTTFNKRLLAKHPTELSKVKYGASKTGIKGIKFSK